MLEIDDAAVALAEMQIREPKVPSEGDGASIGRKLPTVCPGCFGVVPPPPVSLYCENVPGLRYEWDHPMERSTHL